MKKILFCTVLTMSILSCRVSRVKDPLYLIKQDYLDFHVYLRLPDKDTLIGKIVWPASLVRGKDTIILKGFYINE